MSRMILIVFYVACVFPVLAGDLEDGRAAIDAEDYDTAVSLLLPLAENGNADAQSEVGLLYFYGNGVESDHDVALQWIKKAVDQGHAATQNNLGLMYREGMGVTQDYAEALRLFRLSTEQGYAKAYANLGYMYALGLGVKRDDTEAVRLFRIAADKGDSSGQYFLGACYATGQGVEKDFVESFKWYRISAEQGDPSSQERLGYMYEQGQGVEQDIDEAMKWYRMAAEQGDQRAISRMEYLTGMQAMMAPADDLAVSYLWVKFIADIIPHPQGGGTLNIGGEEITPENAEEYRQKYDKRLKLYKEAIKYRGYKTIAGSYLSKTSKSCARIQSSWVSLLHEASNPVVEIEQDGFDALIVIKAVYEGNELASENQAAIAESAVAILDAMNSDYYFRGLIKDNNIQIRPDISVLGSWPKWANPPKRKDLEKCTITLVPLTGKERKTNELDVFYE